MQANLVIESKDTSGKKLTTTVTHIRASEKGKATDLATALNALTTNNYVGAKVNELNVDTAGKTEPTLTITGWSTGTNVTYGQISYNGDGQLFVQCTAAARIINSNTLEVSSTTSFSGSIYATEGTNYAAKTLSFSQ